MKTAREILKENLQTSEYGLPIWKEETIIKAMEEYAEQQSDYVQQLFTRPQEVFKPLQELYRKENPRPDGRFYIPDATKFFKWIANKVNEYECLRNSEHLLNIPCVSVECEHEFVVRQENGNPYGICKKCNEVMKVREH